MATSTWSRVKLAFGSFVLGCVATAGLGLTIALSGCEWRSPAEPAGEPPRYTRAEFTDLVMGKTEAEVLERFGKPERTSADSNAAYWHYHNLTRDPVTGDADDVQVVFRGGKVAALGF